MPILGVVASGISGHLAVPYTPAYYSIATITASGSTPTVTFTSIPSTYTHLQIRMYAGQSGSPAGLIQFNGDTGSNYGYHYMSTSSTTTSAGASTPRSTIAFAAYGGMYASGGYLSPAIVDILDYTSLNKNKVVRVIAGYDTGNGGYVDFTSGAWFGTPAAINSIAITNSSGNWVSTSTFALYGIVG